MYYRIVDAKDEIISDTIKQEFIDFFLKVERMNGLYLIKRYTEAENLQKELAEKLDDIMRVK